MAFGGGNGPYPSNCTTGQVVVGVTFNQNPMVWGYRCAPLNADGTISPLSSTLRSTAGYVFCPDGTAGVGMRMINSGGYRLALVCKTPPGMGDAEQVTQFVKTQASPVFLTRTTESIVMQSMCNAGDVMMGTTTWQNLWFDQLRSRCAPFNKFTLSYNLNGGSGTAPTTQTQTGPATPLTVAAGTGLTRTGFRFGGWNTLASSQGTKYVPGATFIPAGNTTLFAIWESRITYDANGATSGTVPPNTEISGTTNITSLETNSGNLQLTGYTFGGWNTKADGTGTSYPVPTPAIVSDTPYMHFLASNFNDSTNAWTNNGDAARNIPGTAVTASAGNIRGNPFLVTNEAGSNGANKSFPAVQGTTTDGIVLGNAQLNSYTFCHVARYAGANRGRIFAGVTGNWLSGFWGSNAGVAHHEGWITSSSGWNDTNWRVQCATGSTTSGNSGLRVNGVDRTSVTTNTTPLPANITINLQGSRTAPAETSDWAVAEFYIFDSVLSLEKRLHLEAMLNHKYGLTGFTASTLDTFEYASTGDTTLYAQWDSVITYNGNGQTSASSTIPATTIIKGVGTTTTLANQGTMLKTGYTFSGWNTRADGTGTNFAPGTTYTTTGNVTLFARWIAKIDYNSNSASGASNPTTANYLPTVTSIPVSDLAEIGTMTRPGYTLGGWNTRSDGAGITYPEKATFSLPASYMHLLPDNFNDTTNAWTNAVGSTGPNIPATAITSSTVGNIRGNPTKITATGNGATQSFPALKGTTADGILLGNEELRSFTFCHVARYSGATKGAIFVALDTLWFTGFWSNRTAAAYYHNTWIVNSNGSTSGIDNWKVNCATGTAGSNSSSFRENGVDLTTVFNYKTSLPANMTINLHSNRNSPAYTSDWEVAEVLIYDSVLSEGQLRLLENNLCSKYGITCATPNQSYPITGDSILYAKWHANSYKVVYNSANVTSGDMPFTGFTAGTAFSLRSNTFARTGYSFRGWNTQANGSGTSYTNAQSVTLFGDLTLYPQWNLLAPGVPTVTTAPGNTEVIVIPVSPAASGSVGAPTSYTVTAFNSGGAALNPAKSCVVTLPATYCVITGLQNGTTYRFSATATNSAGTSTAGGQVNGTPQALQITYNATTNGGAMGNASVTNKLLSSNVATLTTGSAHGFSVGMMVTVTSVDATFNGTYRISAIPTPTSFSFNKTSANVTSAAVNPAGLASLTTSDNFNKGTPLILSSAGRANYSFAGWYNASSNGLMIGGAAATYSPITDYLISNKALTSNVATLTTSSPHGLTVGAEVVISNVDATFNGTYIVTGVPSSTTFTYAKTTTNVASTPVSPAGFGLTTKASLFAVYVGNTYLISYNGNGNDGGTVPTSGTYQVGGTAHTIQGSTNPPTKTGYTFGGWTLLGASGPPSYYPSGPQTNVPLSSVTDGNWTLCYSDLYSQGINVTTMKTNCTGAYIMFAAAEIGTVGNSTTIKSNTFKVLAAGERSRVFQATTLNTPVLNNGTYWFHTSGTSLGFDPDSSISQGQCYDGGALSLCWHWVTSNEGGFTAGGVVIGNTNSGWVRHVYQSSGAKTDWTVGDSYNQNANANFFAKWIPNTNSITYNANGGTGSVPVSGSFVTGSTTPYTVLVKPADLIRTGYEFVGWNTAANGSGTDYLATGSASLTTSQPLVLYAKWRQITYSYSYQLNGGTSAQPASGTALFGETITVAGTPTRAGFTFAGWHDGSALRAAGASISASSNVVFVAQWSALSYSISYDANGGSGTTAAGSYTSGGVPYPIASNGFTRAGYTFAGWNTQADGNGTNYAPGTGYETSTALTLFAKWSPGVYTIKYNGNGNTGGTAPSDANLTTGVNFSAATNSGSLVKTGYTFVGWNTAANGSGTDYAATGTATLTTAQNLTLFAKWQIVSPTISFNDGDATEPLTVFPANTSAQYGSLFVLPNIDSSTVISSGNYRFAGWSDGANVYAIGDGYRVGVDNVTFTAQWIQVFTVKYVLNGGSGDVPDPVLRNDGFGETLTVSAITRIGHTFSGWKDQSGTTIPSGGGAWTITANSYIAYAQWTPTPVTLSFNLNGGSGSVNPIAGKYVNEVVELPISNSTKEGYIFNGWRINPLYPEGSTYVVGTQDATFNAEWIGRTNSITYNANGGTGSVPASGSFVTGSATPYTVLVKPADLIRTGYEFVGWNTAANGTGTDYAATGSATLTTSTDLTLYAKWSAASYNLTYNTDGGSTAPNASTASFGSTITLPSAPTKSGFNFLGWETGSGADATLHAASASFVMPSRDISFIAKWAGQNYVIAYALNGGTGLVPTQADVTHGNSFTVAAAATRDGFNFTGWSDGTNVLTAGASVTNVVSNMTLVAQWSIAAPGLPGTPTAVPGESSAVVTVVPPSSGGAVSSYTITAAPGGATCTVISPATSCTIIGLTNGTAYNFTASASNTAGNSSVSGSSNTVIPAGLPGRPLGVSGTGTGGNATITWNLPEEDGGSAITDYLVEVSIAGSNSWSTFNDGTSTSRSAVVTGLTAGQSYEFRITTRNAIGNSLPSFTSPIIQTLPTAPLSISAVAGNETATVTWSAPSHSGSENISGYTVTAFDSTGQSAGTCTTNGATTCDVENLVNGNPYTFKVVATTNVGDSAGSSASSAVTPATTPSAPADVTAEATVAGLRVSFSAPASDGGAAITGYTISAQPAGLTCSATGTARTYLCTGGNAGTNYTFTAVATNRVGNSAESLASTAVTALGVPSAPRALTAVITAGSSSLSASISFAPPESDGGSPITSYVVTAAPGGANCTVTAPATSCEITGLSDRAYTFTARAINAMGQSANSSATASTLAANGQAPVVDISPVATPSGNVQEGSTLTSTATYTALPNANLSFVWKRCTSASDESTCVDIVGAISSTYRLTASDADKYIRVQTTAVNSIGTATNISEASALIAAAPTAPPTPSPNPNPEPQPAPVCDATCLADRRAAEQAAADRLAAEKTAAEKAAADKAAAEKVAADKAAAEKAAADKLAAEKEAANKKAQEVNDTASKKAAEAKAAAEKFIEKIAEAAAAKIKLDEATKAATEKEMAAEQAKAAAEKAAAAAKEIADSKNATAAEKKEAAAAAKKASIDAAKKIAAAANSAREAAAVKEAEKKAGKQLDIAINSLTSKTASAQATAAANRIAAAAKDAATAAAKQAAANATAADVAAKQAQADLKKNSELVVIGKKEILEKSTELSILMRDNKALIEKSSTLNTELNKDLNTLAELYKALADDATKLNASNDLAVRNELNKAIDARNQAIVALENNIAGKQTEISNLQASISASDGKISELSKAISKTESEISKLQSNLASQAANVKSLAKSAQVLAKAAEVAKAAAAALPRKAVIQSKPTTGSSKNSAKATITGLKPGQKIRVTVNLGNK